jgi:hypothetical protein
MSKREEEERVGGMSGCRNRAIVLACIYMPHSSPFYFLAELYVLAAASPPHEK